MFEQIAKNIKSVIPVLKVILTVYNGVCGRIVMILFNLVGLVLDMYTVVIVFNKNVFNIPIILFVIVLIYNRAFMIIWFLLSIMDMKCRQKKIESIRKNGKTDNKDDGNRKSIIEKVLNPPNCYYTAFENILKDINKSELMDNKYLMNTIFYSCYFDINNYFSKLYHLKYHVAIKIGSHRHIDYNYSKSIIFQIYFFIVFMWHIIMDCLAVFFFIIVGMTDNGFNEIMLYEKIIIFISIIFQIKRSILHVCNLPFYQTQAIFISIACLLSGLTLFVVVFLIIFDFAGFN